MFERKVTVSLAGLILAAVVILGLVFAAGGLLGGAAGYALARFQAPDERAELPRELVPMPRLEPGQPDLPEGHPPLEGGPIQPVERPYLGVFFAPITPDLAEAEDLPVNQGALIREVQPDTPAEQAGLQPGDIVTALDGAQITEDRDLQDLVLEHEPGDRVELTVTRNGQEMTVAVELGRRVEMFFQPDELPFPEDSQDRG